MHRKHALLAGGAICLLASTALAQTPQPGPGANGASVAKGTIETVIVTAEKREQKSQDVPVPLSAISGDLLDKQGIRDVASLGNRVPSLYFGPGPTGGENFITMRGLTSANTTIAGDTPVSLSIDGVYFGRSTGVDPEMFDMQTIEVLRGPQGTLYGRNSVGGSINVVTNKPTDDFSGHVDALIGDYNARILRGWANVPLYDCGDCKILARFVGVSANHDGYQKNLSQAPTATHDSDGQNYDMLRGHLLFEFNPDVSLLLSASESHSYDPVATKTQWNELNPTDPTYRFGGQTWYNDPRVVEKDYPERFTGILKSMSATFNWNMGWAKLTSITARQTIYMHQSNDADGSNLDLVRSEGWQNSTGQYSEELRLASTDDANPLRWVIGGFYFHEHADSQFPFGDTGLNAAPFTAFNVTDHQDFSTTSYAVFGQVDYDLGKTSAEIPLTITGGLRYTHDKKYGFEEGWIYLPDIPVPPNGLLVFSELIPENQSFGQITGKGGLSYKFTPDVMAYANVSHGYLSGGYLTRFYKPETVWDYELGFKSQFLDNTIQLNGNIYWMDVTNAQVFVQDFINSRIDNADGATIRGLEAELIAIPVEGLRLNAELSVTDAKYKNYFTDDGRYPGTVIVNNKGNRLVQTPKWTLDAGAEYAIDTSAGTFTPRVDVFTSSNVFLTAFNTPLAEQGAYTLVDLAVKWTDVKNRYQVDAFVRNVFDKDVLASDGLQSGSLGNGIEVDNFTYRAPRTVGVRFGVNF